MLTKYFTTLENVSLLIGQHRGDFPGVVSTSSCIRSADFTFVSCFVSFEALFKILICILFQTNLGLAFSNGC